MFLRVLASEKKLRSVFAERESKIMNSYPSASEKFYTISVIIIIIIIIIYKHLYR